MLKRLFQADFFRIVVCDDDDTVEVCGALKVLYSILINAHAPISTSVVTINRSNQLISK